MMVKSYLTGGVPRERMKNVILDDHLECVCKGCQDEDCLGPLHQNEQDKDPLCENSMAVYILMGVSFVICFSCVTFLTFLVKFYHDKLLDAQTELKKVEL